MIKERVALELRLMVLGFFIFVFSCKVERGESEFLCREGGRLGCFVVFILIGFFSYKGFYLFCLICSDFRFLNENNEV